MSNIRTKFGKTTRAVPEICSRTDTKSVDVHRCYRYGEVTSQSLWSRYDHHFVGLTRYNALS